MACMKPIEVIEAKREHLARLANQRGALGESSAIGEMQEWIPRPKGPGLKILLAALRESGVNIKPRVLTQSLCLALMVSILQIWRRLQRRCLIWFSLRSRHAIRSELQLVLLGSSLLSPRVKYMRQRHWAADTKWPYTTSEPGRYG